MSQPNLSLSFAAQEQAQLDAKLASAEDYAALRLVTTDKLFSLVKFSYDQQQWILPHESFKKVLNLAVNTICDFVPAHRQSRDEIVAIFKRVPERYERMVLDSAQAVRKGQDDIRELREQMGDLEDDASRAEGNARLAEEKARMAEEKANTIMKQNAQLIQITDNAKKENSKLVEAALEAEGYKMGAEYLAHIKERVQTNLDDIFADLQVDEQSGEWSSSRLGDLQGMAIELLAELGQGRMSKEDLKRNLGKIAWMSDR
jgi:hypothetical protein